MGSAAKRGSIIFDYRSRTISFCTCQRSEMLELAKHPQARMVKVEVDRDLTVTSGEWKFPFEYFRLTLTGGEAEIVRMIR